MSFIRAIRMLLTLRCEESTRLVSDSFERPLTPVERWSVRLHAISCRYCRQFAHQLRLINEAARRRADGAMQMTAEMRRRLAARIAEEIESDS